MMLSMHTYIHTLTTVTVLTKAVADSPVGQVLAGPLFLKIKYNCISQKQVINKKY